MARGSATFETNQKDVTTTSQLLVPARPGRISVVITPMSTVTVYLGKEGVTAQTGLFIQGGSPVTLDTAEAIYGLSTDATRISYIEYV